MMSRHFALNSEHTGAIAKRLPHAKNQPSAPGSFFNQFVTDIYIYIYIQSSSFNSKDIYIYTVDIGYKNTGYKNMSVIRTIYLETDSFLFITI